MINEWLKRLKGPWQKPVEPPRRVFQRELSAEEVARTAVHEAAHAYLAWTQPFLFVRGVRVTERGAQVDLSYGPVTYERFFWDRMALSYAGIAAETAFFGTVRSKGMQTDLKDGKAEAQALLRKNPRAAPPWETKPRKFGVSRMYQEGELSHSEAIAVDHAYWRARQVVDENREKIGQLAKLFQPKLFSGVGGLSEAEIQAVYGAQVYLGVRAPSLKRPYSA